MIYPLPLGAGNKSPSIGWGMPANSGINQKVALSLMANAFFGNHPHPSPLPARRQHIPVAIALHGRYQSGALHFFDQAGGAVVTDAQLPLHR